VAGRKISISYISEICQRDTDARFGALLVTNNFGIVAGQDEEDDDSLRYRLNLKLRSTGGAAEADLRLAILNVPGIQDVQFAREAGTYTACIYGISPAVPPSLLQMVQAQIDATTAWPLTGTAINPDLIGISFSTTVTFVAGATSAEQQTALANAVRTRSLPAAHIQLFRARARTPQQLAQLLRAGDAAVHPVFLRASRLLIHI
jgi:hypothetical protein